MVSSDAIFLLFKINREDLSMHNHPSKAAWRRSTFCNGADACVEIAPENGHCGHNGNCLVANLCDCGEVLKVLVRDSKLGDSSPVLEIPTADWVSFLDRVKNWPGWPGGLVQAVRYREDVWWVWLTSDPATRLHFTEAEMSAFWKGVHAHEFDLSALAAGDGSDESARARVSEPPTAGVGVKNE